MVSDTPPSRRRIVVVGGGITGLAAAHRMVELATERSQAVEVLLLEASEQPGGVIRSRRQDGFLLESGPDSFITDKPWALALCRRLGLEEELIETDGRHRRSFVLSGGRLLPVPEGFHLLAPALVLPFLSSRLVSWPGKIRMIAEWLLPPRRRSASDDESLAEFVGRRFGREALERIAQPMIAGIYGADPRTLSLRATMPRFLEMEQRHGGVIRGLRARRRASTSSLAAKGGAARELGAAHPPAAGRSNSTASGVSGARYGLFLSFRDGVQTLVDALCTRLPPGCLRCSTRVSALSLAESGRWRLQLDPGLPDGEEEMETDAVCVALPAYTTTGLLCGLDPTLAGMLAEIPYAASGTLNLAFRRADVAHPLDGFGFVVPAVEKRLLLGCTFSSVKFSGRAPEGHVLLRAFIGERGLSGRDDAAVTAAVLRELSDLLGISSPPLFTEFWSQVRAMPQYLVGHLDRVAAIEAAAQRHPGLALAGNGFRGIGLPDCVHSGEQAAERLMSGGSSAT